MATTRAKSLPWVVTVPPDVITNADLERMVDTNHEWIVSRTGITERHVASADMATSDLATAAARIALENRGVSANDLDAIIVCTVTPDMLFPATACLVQNNLGAKACVGVRSHRGMQRFHIRHQYRGKPGHVGAEQKSSGHWRRHHDAHPELQGPARPVCCSAMGRARC